MAIRTVDLSDPDPPSRGMSHGGDLEWAAYPQLTRRAVSALPARIATSNGRADRVLPPLPPARLPEDLLAMLPHVLRGIVDAA